LTSKTRAVGRTGGDREPGVGRDGAGLQKTFLLQTQRVQDFVVPKNVAARTPSFGEQRLGQPDRLGGFDVKLRPHLDARLRGVVGEDRLRKLRVLRTIHDHLLAGRRPAAQGDRHKRQGQTTRRRAPGKAR
jgi:hypothetical protein